MQDGETVGFDLARHIEVLVAHTSAGLVDIVLANNHPAPRPGLASREISPKAVSLRWPPRSTTVPRLYLDDVVDADHPHHHDPARLAASIIRAFEGEAGIRRRTAGRTASRSA
jgi:hypothetical protein